VLRWLAQYVDVEKLNPHDYLRERLGSLGGAIAGRTLGLIGGVAAAVVKFFFIIFTMYYLFRDGERISGALREVIPLEREQSQHIFDRTREVIHASVYGVLVIAAIQGTLAGSFLVWVPAAIFLAAGGHWAKALILAAWGMLVISTIDNFLRPKLVGKKTRLHELMIFFSVLCGVQVFGVLGLILGPVVVAITLALLDVSRQMDRSFRFTPPEPAMIDDRARSRNVQPRPDAPSVIPYGRATSS